MCHASNYIMLCTCGGDIPMDSRWELFPSEGLPAGYMVGSIIPPFERPDISADELTRELLKRKIEEDLNNHDCFDFPYTAANDDILKLHLGATIFQFVYCERNKDPQSGYWQASGWVFPRTPEPEKKGKISLKHCP